jgi:gamma-glutamylcyclotransferase (GGCT)/AIG2-like uncharacterized protein YtfP
MTTLVFFYGTLMSGFHRLRRSRLDGFLEPVGRAWIRAALFDLGIYPAAIPAADSQVWGEVCQMLDAEAVLTETDELQGFNPNESDSSLYRRVETVATFEDGHQASAWVYFYNAPLGQAERIESGDYLEHLKVGQKTVPEQS